MHGISARILRFSKEDDNTSSHKTVLSATRYRGQYFVGHSYQHSCDEG